MRQLYCAPMWPNWHGASQQLSRTASVVHSGRWGSTSLSLDTPFGSLSSPSWGVDNFDFGYVIWKFVFAFGSRLRWICHQEVYLFPLQGKLTSSRSLTSTLEVVDFERCRDREAVCSGTVMVLTIWSCTDTSTHLIVSLQERDCVQRTLIYIIITNNNSTMVVLCLFCFKMMCVNWISFQSLMAKLSFLVLIFFSQEWKVEFVEPHGKVKIKDTMWKLEWARYVFCAPAKKTKWRTASGH